MLKTVLIAALASLTFTAAQAAEPATTASRTVRTADLDLTTAKGAKTMAHRIRVAANAVCGGENRLTFGSPRLAECRKQVAAASARQLDAPLVSAELDRAQVRVLSQR